MNKKAVTAILGAVLAWLGVVASITGIISDEKSFYVIAAACMSLASLLFLFFSRSAIRPGR